jgi:hypothetical protein
MRIVQEWDPSGRARFEAKFQVTQRGRIAMRFLKDVRRAVRAGSGRPVVVGMAVLSIYCSLSSTATAASHHPKGEFTQFGECPLDRATLTDCLYGVINGGSFALGKKTVPVRNPIVLQGGFEGAGAEIQFFGAQSGPTISNTPQSVPGGLVGLRAPVSWPKPIQEWFNGSVSSGLTGVSVTVELAAPATSIKLDTENLVFQEGIALGLPIKIHIENPMFGNNCYLGSSAKPIQLEFTTGTTAPPLPNKPLKGFSGRISFNPEFTLLSIGGVRLVDNAFAVPQRASGCGGSFAPFIDPLVDSILGTPSVSGRNTGILESDLKDAAAPAVRKSE